MVVMEWVNRFQQEIIHYFQNTRSVVILQLDEKLRIVSHNELFTRIISGGRDLIGQPVSSVLSGDSLKVLPIPDSTNSQALTLSFSSVLSSVIALQCNIYRNKDNEYLIIGSNMTLSNDEILQKMTLLSNEMANLTRDLNQKNRELKEAYARIKKLSGIIPICSHCKQIRDDKGYWNQLEDYISEHSEALFSHGICDKCLKKHYSEMDIDFDEDD